jgi:hypothetical protein
MVDEYPLKTRWRWWELEYLVPYRDAVLVIGFIVFETGVFFIPRIGLQAGLLTTGAGLMVAAWRVLRP